MARWRMRETEGVVFYSQRKGDQSLFARVATAPLAERDWRLLRAAQPIEFVEAVPDHVRCGQPQLTSSPASQRGLRRSYGHSPLGQVRTLLDNFDGDALGMGRTAGRVRSACARSSSSRIARS